MSRRWQVYRMSKVCRIEWIEGYAPSRCTLTGSTVNFGSTVAGGTNALTITGNLDLDAMN